jgi:hypothetical protein
MSDISMVDMTGIMAGVVMVVGVLLLEVVDITEMMVEEGEGIPPPLLVGFSSSSITCPQQQ